MTKPKARKLKIGTDKYEYLDVGKGTPVFCFHGMGSTKESFYGFIKSLKNKYRLIIPDLPGHQNIKLDKYNNPEEFSSYCNRFINHFNFTKYGILGFSFGGNIALSVSNNLFKNKKMVIPTAIWAAPLKESMLNKKARRVFQISRLINPKYFKTLSNKKYFWTMLDLIGIKLNQGDQDAIKKTDLRVLQKGEKLLVGEKHQERHPLYLYIFDNQDIFVSPPSENLNNVIYVKGGGHFGNQKAQNKSIEEIIRFYHKNGL